jgi:hypothetical protein
MRLFEVVTPPTRVLVTPEFSESYSEFVSSTPVVEEKFKRFISLKLNGDKLPDDALFSNGHLRGYWHHHFIKGKVIVIYRQVGNDLRLYIVTNHYGYDGTRGQRLGQWMSALADSNFTELDLKSLFAEPEKETQSLSPEQKEKVDGIIYDLISADGFYILKPAIEKNEWEGFIEWLENDMPGVTPETVFAAYGGAKQLQAFILHNIVQFGKTAEYKNT